MALFCFAIRVLKSIYWRLRRLLRWFELNIVDRIQLLIYAKRNKCIFVFGSPDHSNLGDNAQTLCVRELLQRDYPQYKIKFFTDGYLQITNYKVVDFLSKICREDVIIILHSGYHMTDLYMRVELANRRVVQAFNKQPILAFPQTILYKSELELNKSKKIYNAHPNLTIMCRDEVSYEFAKVHFSKCKLFLMPDVVTSKIGFYSFKHDRNGILLCKRRDVESNYSESVMVSFTKRLQQISDVTWTDTTVEDSWEVINKNLKKYLECVWENYAKYKVVVTDRYHGTIFSLIANTPVVVLPSADHKLSSGVNWFPDSFKGYVYFAPTLEEAERMITKIYEESREYVLPTYFYDNYYANYRTLVEWKK